MEPIARRRHPALEHRPELEGTQAIIDCGNGFGLSVIGAKGPRQEHGLYCSDDTYEACLIRFGTNPVIDAWDYELAYRLTPAGDPIGWLSIEQVGALAERVALEGASGFREE